jgi:polyhydroxyalkanoate synthesis repressor PhaR
LRERALCPLFLFVLQSHRLFFAVHKIFGENDVGEDTKPLLIKRYASRRLYNTETSDYVTLDDIAGFIRSGREVQIIDLKSGDDLTRQYLLQIIAEHESRGENVLPVNVLNDLVRAYTTQATSMVPQFLQTSFDMLRDSQEKVMESMGPGMAMPGLEAIQVQQEAFLKAMTGGMAWPGGAAPGAETEEAASSDGEDLDDIKKQLAELQDKLSKLK